ncbi:MAG: hypothetical protein LBS49_10285 [Candidatus Accumulibacter sp.]|jgi:ElaB/YqjD/DUF883 family membrane-anchored ribosome-binding protein|nr:hypothetical protein [Accumulibacter sp.]
MLENPKNMATVAAIIEKIDSAHAEFSELSRELEKIKGHRDTLLKAAAAAEEEAENVREELKQVMHDTAGKPGKTLLGKQAEHRAALEMAEDYKALAEEASDEAVEIRVKMSSPARDLERSRRELETSFPRLVIREAIESIAPSLKIALDSMLHEYRRDDFSPFNPSFMFFKEHEIAESLLISEIRKAIDLKNTNNETPDYIKKALKKRATGFVPYSTVQIAQLKRGIRPVGDPFNPRQERKEQSL